MNRLKSYQYQIESQFKHKHAYFMLVCVLLVDGIVQLVDVQAQAPQKAQILFTSDRDKDFEIGSAIHVMLFRDCKDDLG